MWQKTDKVFRTSEWYQEWEKELQNKTASMLLMVLQ